MLDNLDEIRTENLREFFRRFSFLWFTEDFNNYLNDCLFENRSRVTRP